MSEIKIKCSFNGTQAVAGLSAVAEGVTLVKTAMGGLQTVMFGFMAINAAISMLQQIAAMIEKAGKAIVKYFGDDSALDRAAGKITKLARSFELLKNYEKKEASEKNVDRGYEDAVASAELRRERARIDQRTADSLLSEPDPVVRQRIIAAAELEKSRLALGFSNAQADRNITRIDRDIKSNDSNSIEARQKLGPAQLQYDELKRLYLEIKGTPFQDEERIKKAEDAMNKAKELVDDITEYIDRLVEQRLALARQRTIVEADRTTAYIGASIAESTFIRQREDAVRELLKDFFDIDNKDVLKRKKREDEINLRAAKAMEKITVNQPRAATSLGAIGGIMGSDVSGANAASIAAQRHAQEMEIQKEQLRALSKIAQNTEE